MDSDDFSAFTDASSPSADVAAAASVPSPTAPVVSTSAPASSAPSTAPAKPVQPFGLVARNLTQTVNRATILKNWKVKADPHQNYFLIVTQWAPGKGTSVGVGASSGVRSAASSTFGKEQFRASEVWYDRESNSWIFKRHQGKDDKGAAKFYRAPYGNAYQNERYHNQAPGEINAEIAKAKDLKIW